MHPTTASLQPDCMKLHGIRNKQNMGRQLKELNPLYSSNQFLNQMRLQESVVWGPIPLCT